MVYDDAPFGESGVMVLDYDPKINRFIDNFGVVIHDIYKFVTPAQVDIFKEYRSQYLIPDRTNTFLVELVYPDEGMF